MMFRFVIEFRSFDQVSPQSCKNFVSNCAFSDVFLKHVEALMESVFFDDFFDTAEFSLGNVNSVVIDFALFRILLLKEISSTGMSLARIV